MISFKAGQLYSIKNIVSLAQSTNNYDILPQFLKSATISNENIVFVYTD